LFIYLFVFIFFFSSRRRHTRFSRDWSSDVCSSDLYINSDLIKWEDNYYYIIYAPLSYLTHLNLKSNCLLDVVMNFLTKNNDKFRSEERRVGKECRSRWSPVY